MWFLLKPLARSWKHTIVQYKMPLYTVALQIRLHWKHEKFASTVRTLQTHLKRDNAPVLHEEMVCEGRSGRTLEQSPDLNLTEQWNELHSRPPDPASVSDLTNALINE